MLKKTSHNKEKVQNLLLNCHRITLLIYNVANESRNEFSSKNILTELANP